MDAVRAVRTIVRQNVLNGATRFLWGLRLRGQNAAVQNGFWPFLLARRQ
jgi:hypothetical protein